VSVRTVVNERTRFEVAVEFLDADGAPAAPSAVEYRIDDAGTGAEILDWTSIDPESEVTIPVTSEQNRILDDANQIEIRLLTVRAVLGADAELPEEFEWAVKNLRMIPKEE